MTDGESRDWGRALARGWTFFLRHQPPILAAILVAAFFMTEIVLHAKPFPPYAADLLFYQAADMSVHQASDNPRLLMELKPGARDVYDQPEQPRRYVTINALGLRDPVRAVPKPQGTFRILVLGSSTTFGAAVNDDQTLTAHLENLLNEKGRHTRVEVINAGVNSYGPSQMTAMGDRVFAAGIDPDLVLFQFYLTGPRAFLKNQPRIEPFAQDLTLASEYFLMPSWLTERIGGWIAAHSRLGLLGLAYYTRKTDPQQREQRLAKVQKTHHLVALDRFRLEHIGLPFYGFVFPCPKKEDVYDLLQLAEEAQIETWCLPPPGVGTDYLEAHPPSYVYEAYAAALIRHLDEVQALPE